ncbi:MAG: molybdopterin-dependent oxidoreductase, partial [Chloroflexota bacterium]
MSDRRASGSEQVVFTGCGVDCGGRCVLRVHLRDGRITRVETDDGEEPQYRACARGRAARQSVYSPDRLRFPLKRVGERGQGRFERISWDEALDTVAAGLKRVKETCGPAAILYRGSGPNGVFHNNRPAFRLLNMFGGCTTTWGNISNGASIFASMASYGTMSTGNTRDDLVNSRLILMWGWNPACTIWDTNTPFDIIKAREAGARIVCIDPRFTDSAALFADRWIPIRPATDVAMLLAMAYVMIEEGLCDQKFLNAYTIGFDKFRDYVMGTEDGLARTPAWAESITGVSATTIESLAREYAASRPAALIAGWAPGRTAYGEQYHRAAIALAAMTGNIGIHGGNAAGWERSYPNQTPRVPVGINPVD